uniref:Uncharacterized protein n=1 Tax=Anguilla anguilla TaxID=7936 RepID=A0A0E9V0N9_ANGAN
MQCYRHSVTG